MSSPFGQDPELIKEPGTTGETPFIKFDNFQINDPSLTTEFRGGNIHVGFSVQHLFSVVGEATISAKLKILEIRARRSAISIGDMFEMQMLMNHLSQLSEMSTSVVSAAHSAISSMARNVKG